MGGEKVMPHRKKVVFTPHQLAGAIRTHGLPVTLEAAGTGVIVCITTIAEIAQKGRNVLRTAQAMGNGLVIND